VDQWVLSKPQAMHCVNGLIIHLPIIWGNLNGSDGHAPAKSVNRIGAWMIVTKGDIAQ